MSLLSNLPGFNQGGGNATVPVDAFIMPPHAYVDNIEYFTSVMGYGNMNSYPLLLSNKGITGVLLKFIDATGTEVDPYLTNGSQLDFSYNLIPADGVISIFGQIRNLAEFGLTGSHNINTFGPNMGCPLNVPGTVGGWTMRLDTFTAANDTQIIPIYYPGLLTYLSGRSDTDLVDSYVSVNNLAIGIQDGPTMLQIMEKIAELYPSINPNGTTEMVDGAIVHTSTLPAAWSVGLYPFTETGEISTSGTNPTNADIDYLITQSCTGSFTGPDGITQINF